ncbi:hypothetical protein LCGC14_0466610 [marine sediment metagenome]|uniref:DNA transfer protein n=1 Tax=marine sediment metagenome TaxID=412755 RepID=A0A0F9V079_9ZZZZ
MPAISTGTALAIGGIAAAGGAVASGVIGSRAAGRAAGVQAEAGTRAAELQAQSAREALAFQREQFATTQENFAPWLQTGRGALANLSYLMGIPGQQQEAGGAVPGAGGEPRFVGSGSTGTRGGVTLPPRIQALLEARGKGGRPSEDGVPLSTLAGGSTLPPGGIPFEGGSRGAPTPVLAGAEGEAGNLSSLVNPELGEFGSLMQPFGEEFEAPTLETMQLTPGYQFRLQEGQDVLEHSAAARGNLLTGATSEALTRYGQDYASGEYSNVYNRALTEYQQNYNIFQQNQANQFNRLASLSGVGQTAAGQLSSAGQFAAGNVSNILLGSAAQQGQSIQNAAAARASGYVGSANAITGGIAGATGSLSDLLLAQALRRPEEQGE